MQTSRSIVRIAARAYHLEMVVFRQEQAWMGHYA